MTGQDYLFAWGVILAWIVICIAGALYMHSLTPRD
jgi:hypothetical protein